MAGRDDYTPPLVARLFPLGPLLLFAYPLVGLLSSTSQYPVVLGRWSPALAAILALCIAAYVVAGVASWSRRDGMLKLALLLVVVLSYALPSSNAAQRLVAIQYVLPGVRLLAAGAWLVMELHAWRERRRVGPFMAAALVLGIFALGDLGLALATRARPPHAKAADEGFRSTADRAPPHGATVIIGDSFVWGQGVEASERFGDRLQARWAASGEAHPVVSLGLVGAGVTDYQHLVRRASPERPARQIVLSFYANDMPPKERAVVRLHYQLIALGVGAPTLRLLGDVLARRAAPTMDGYLTSVIEDYDPSEASFASRWGYLKRSLASIRSDAAARSVEPPVLLLLPLMMDFDPYPLQAGHDRVHALGRELGYSVVDMLPVFRRELGHGRDYLVAPDDNHFDARVHDLVAATLAERLR
jgi:hypothetical protein